jgi:hypothetical protein
MDSLFFLCCRRKQVERSNKQQKQKQQSAPPPPQLSPSEISAGLSAAQILLIDAGQALIADCCLIVEEDDLVSGASGVNSGDKPDVDKESAVVSARQHAVESLKVAGVSSVEAAAKVLRISLIPRGSAPVDRAARLRYVKATAEKVFERLDEIQPQSQDIRENRRKAIITLQACERRADVAFTKLMQPS